VLGFAYAAGAHNDAGAQRRRQGQWQHDPKNQISQFRLHFVDFLSWKISVAAFAVMWWEKMLSAPPGAKVGGFDRENPADETTTGQAMLFMINNVSSIAVNFQSANIFL
jgi:hypothetical protein